jgi:hypothetical protein
MERLLSKSSLADREVRSQIRGLLTLIYPGGFLADRRKDPRFPYPKLIYLTPVGRDGRTPQGESIVVTGKQISEGGLAFFHQNPLPNRRMIASLETHDGRFMGFLIDICWCRFTRHGWYESGSRLLECVAAPAENASLPTELRLTADEIARQGLVGGRLSTTA